MFLIGNVIALRPVSTKYVTKLVCDFCSRIQDTDEGTAKLGIVLCSNCATNMYKESQKEDYNDN